MLHTRWGRFACSSPSAQGSPQHSIYCTIGTSFSLLPASSTPHSFDFPLRNKRACRSRRVQQLPLHEPAGLPASSRQSPPPKQAPWHALLCAHGHLVPCPSTVPTLALGFIASPLLHCERVKSAAAGKHFSVRALLQRGTARHSVYRNAENSSRHAAVGRIEQGRGEAQHSRRVSPGSGSSSQLPTAPAAPPLSHQPFLSVVKKHIFV